MELNIKKVENPIKKTNYMFTEEARYMLTDSIYMNYKNRQN